MSAYFRWMLPGHLLTSLTDKLLSRRANRLNLTARTSLSETGVNVLFLTFGVLRWFESPDSQVPLLAPLLLVPVRLARENIDSPWLLAYDDEDVATNFTIGQKIGTEFGFQWPDLPDDFDPSSSPYGEYLDRVRASVSSARRWVVEDRVGLGTFSFQKIAMWRDLGANATAIGEHGICRAIAGESRTSSPGGVIDVRESDQKIKPRDLYTIRDCDSTQLEAILAAKGGVSFVLDGPPGTGKSQTITNIISEFIASGKTVLFVSEKAAALEVVKRRLDETGLGDFCLECHSHKANKKVVLAELHRCLNLEQVRYRDQREDLDRLFEMRARLTAYVRALHKPRGAVELTAYQVHGRLAEVRTRGITRCTIGGVLEIDRAGLRRRQEALAAMRPHQHVLDAQERHPWRGTLLSSISLTDEDDVRDRFTATAEAIEALRKAIEPLNQLGFGPPDPAYPEVESNLQSARSTIEAPEVPATWFAGNAADVCNAIQRLCSGATAVTEARRALSSYRSDVHQAWEGKLRGSMRALGSPALARLKRVPAVTVRGEIGRLAETLSRIDAMIRELTGLKATLSAIAELLRQPTSGTSLHGAEQIATIAEVVAGLPEVQYSWTESGTRSQLRALVDRCTPLSETVTRLRDSLEGVGCTGFDDRGAEIAVAAEHYTSFWSRLSPGWWWALRSRARALYGPNGCSRTTSELLSDLRELRLFHEHQSALTRELEPLKRQVPVLDSPDAWFRFGTTLERLDQLRAWSADGDGLLGALGRPSGVNRQAVRRHCDALKAQIESVRNAAAVLGQSWSLEPIGVAGQLLEQSPIEDVLRALEDARGGISAARGLFVGWAGLLADKRDIPVNQIKKDAQLLDQLVAAHDGVSKTYASLKGHVPAVNDPSRHEWGTLATAARWVLDQLERSPGGVSAHIVRVVTDPNVRRRLMETLSACQRLKPAVETGYRHLSTVFPNEANVSTGVVVNALSLSALRSWLVACAGDVGCLREWTEFRRALVALERLGLQELATEICERKLLITDAESAFLKRFYRAWLDAVYAQDAALKDFRFDEHEKLIDQFRSLDRAAVAGSAKRIREKLLASADRPNPSLAAPRTSELGTLLREANKKRRHLPLRQLFREIPTVLTKLKPCVMMSPLAVSTFFDSPQLRFDLVIFDEASQVRPQDAIGAIYRGKQLIVAGDQKQLPPTAFFEAAVRDDGVSEDEEEDEDDLADFESILDIGVTTGMPRKSLLWHYRSRRESLIAFSNHHIYDGDLVTFPSARDTPGSSAVTLVHVNDGRWVRSGRNARNPVEARRVAELVMEHFRDRPKQSIGVVAFSQAQQMAILTELERPECVNDFWTPAV